MGRADTDISHRHKYKCLCLPSTNLCATQLLGWDTVSVRATPREGGTDISVCLAQTTTCHKTDWSCAVLVALCGSRGLPGEWGVLYTFSRGPARERDLPDAKR